MLEQPLKPNNNKDYEDQFITFCKFSSTISLKEDKSTKRRRKQAIKGRKMKEKENKGRTREENERKYQARKGWIKHIQRECV